jgi:hypothetical protein
VRVGDDEAVATPDDARAGPMIGSRDLSCGSSEALGDFSQDRHDSAAATGLPPLHSGWLREWVGASVIWAGRDWQKGQLVGRWFLGAIDHDGIEGGGGRFEFEAELFFEDSGK